MLKSISQRLNDTEAQYSYNVYIYTVWEPLSMTFHRCMFTTTFALKIILRFCFTELEVRIYFR